MTDLIARAQALVKRAEFPDETIEVINELVDRVLSQVDGIVHYRNLSIALGAQPNDMLNSWDRGLCEAHHAGRVIDKDPGGWWNDAPNTWIEYERACSERDAMQRRAEAAEEDWQSLEKHALNVNEALVQEERFANRLAEALRHSLAGLERPDDRSVLEAHDERRAASHD